MSILDKLNVPKLRPNLVFLQPKLISSAALANKLMQAKTVVCYQQSMCSLQLFKTEQSEELAGWLASISEKLVASRPAANMNCMY